MRAVLIVALVAIVACGDESTLLAVNIQRGDALIYAPARMDIRVYGSGASCTTLLANVVSLPAERCIAAEVESGTCYIEERAGPFASGTVSEPILVPVGDRQVLVRGYQEPIGVVAKGCSGVAVRQGETARATIVLQDHLF